MLESQKVAVAHRPGTTRRLNFVRMKRFGTKFNAVLNSEAVPNFVSTSLIEGIMFSPDETTRKIEVANGSSSLVQGVVKDVPVLFGDSWSPLNFAIMDESLLDVIIGSPTSENIQG